MAKLEVELSQEMKRRLDIKLEQIGLTSDEYMAKLMKRDLDASTGKPTTPV